MSEFLETTVDKFIFKVATDRYYTTEGVWALAEDGRVRVGLSDFVQQLSGDVAFAEVSPEGTAVAAGDEIATIETIKVNVGIASPVRGTVVEVNPEMEMGPEIINSDPYSKGWLAIIEADDWENDRANLLDPQAYFVQMKAEAEEEAKNL